MDAKNASKKAKEPEPKQEEKVASQPSSPEKAIIDPDPEDSNEIDEENDLEALQLELKNLERERDIALDKAQKAHDAIIELASENEYFHTTYVEHEAHRRRADGRTKRLAEALDSSQRGIEHWQKIIDGGFDRLLTNATTVKEGGKSSSVRNRKPAKAPQKKGKARRASTAKPQPEGEEE